MKKATRTACHACTRRMMMPIDVGYVKYAVCRSSSCTGARARAWPALHLLVLHVRLQQAVAHLDERAVAAAHGVLQLPHALVKRRPAARAQHTHMHGAIS